MITTPNTLQVIFKRKEFTIQPNSLTESKQEFTDNEKNILSYVLNQLRRDVLDTWQEGQNLEYLIPVSELTDKNHTRVMATAKSMMHKRIITYDNPEGVIIDGVTIYFQGYVPFPNVEYIKIGNQSFIQLIMLANVVPYFIYLSKQYTRYSLDTILSMQSVYSQRIYEILMMNVGRKQMQFTYTFEKLKFILNCPDSYTFSEIRKRALEPAQKELKEKADIYFTFKETLKVGKRVDELTFYIKTKKDAALDALSDEAVEFDKSTPLEKRDHVLRMLNNYKFSKAQQNDIMSDPKKWSVFMQLDAEIFHGLRTDIENPTAYIAKSLGFDKVSAKTKSK